MKIFRLLALAATLALAALLPAAAQNAPVASKYWGGTGYCEYKQYNIGGYYNATTMELDVWSRVPTPGNAGVRRTFVPTPLSQYPAVALVHTPAGTAPAPPAGPWPSNIFVLYQTLWNRAGTPAFIGEGGGPNQVNFPPEAELTVTPVTGEVINITIAGYAWNPTTGSVVNQGGPVRYKTIGPGPGPNGVWWWAQYPDDAHDRRGEPRNVGAGPQGVRLPVLSRPGGHPQCDTWWTAAGINADGTFSGGEEWQVTTCVP